jgi:hypothetical protein
LPRYLIRRSFEQGEPIPLDSESAVEGVLAANARDQVTWIHSYLSRDRRHMFCVYEAASPEAVRHASASSHLPIDSITEVSLVDPYFHRLSVD